MSEFDYDLIVIGAGSGGTRTARISASYGAKTLVIEGDRAGGTCVLRGCVLKKLLVYASQFSEQVSDAEGFCWQINSFKSNSKNINLINSMTILKSKILKPFNIAWIKFGNFLGKIIAPIVLAILFLLFARKTR